MKSKSGVFSGSFLKNTVGGGHSFYNFFNRDLLKRSFGNPALDIGKIETHTRYGGTENFNFAI